MDVRQAALTLAENVTSSPTWTGVMKAMRSTPAVTTRQRECLTAAAPAASSQSFMTTPPWMNPALFASSTPIHWISCVCDSATVRASTSAPPGRLGEARQAVVGNRLPNGGVVGELMLLGADPRIAVDGAKPHADVAAGLRVVAVERRAAVRAEALREAAVARVPALHEPFALGDSERALGRARVCGRPRAGASLTACAVAVVGGDEGF